MKFLEELSEDIRKNLLEQLRVLWTHSSTAIEGNSLTLGETAFVLSEGLTVSGKPLKDHRDVEGHARAIDLMSGLVHRDEITEQDLFDLHRLIVNDPVVDVYKPAGAWKRENNSVNVAVNDRMATIEFSDYWEVPELMERWLKLLNSEIRTCGSPEIFLKCYARLHVSLTGIHPFWDGNGRIARLIANLPGIKAGYPPIVIEKERRFDYIEALAEYTLANGVPSRDTELVREDSRFEEFCSFLAECWRSTLSLVEDARALQRERDLRMKERESSSFQTTAADDSKGA